MSAAFVDRLAHRFADPGLLRQALTHRSLTQGRDRGLASNERLEFVGDRVLGLVIAEWLVERFPQEREGGLGRRLAHLVNQETLAAIAGRIGLGEALIVPPSEAATGVKRRATVLADACEAVIGALYLDGGLEAARDFIRAHWAEEVESVAVAPRDPKTALQEWAQARGLALPEYRTLSSEGPSHRPRFTVAVTVGETSADGTGVTKREAEKAAAAALLARLETRR
ncbi:ribonuclease III [Elioraea sp. Yellowstone]|uniref:ribonuclease III n=1 Tax=Elioraea sp. Yellowstone TaxID=2592070 RepID=UPI0011542FAE|nr:ribonuclease III [Elioraea sp. Yellowstone]TQF85283.1 ribonuclease III [Elioraea sp. Yellowstone]